MKLKPFKERKFKRVSFHTTFQFLILRNANTSMNNAFVFTLIALLYGALTEAAITPFLAHRLQSSGETHPVQCMLRHCPIEMAQCGFHSECRQCSACMQACPQSNDPTLCQTHCFFKYADPTFNRLTQCGVDHHCFESMTWSNRTCPSAIAQRTPTFDVQWLAAGKEFVVLRGSHPVYDCLPCQRLEMVQAEPPEDGVWTHWSTALDGVVRGAMYNLRQENANTLVTTYTLFGMPVEEHYYILDYSPCGRYLLYFYCGFGFGRFHFYFIRVSCGADISIRR